MRRASAVALALVLALGVSGCVGPVPEPTHAPTAWPSPNPEDAPTPPVEEGPYCCTVILPGSGIIF